MNEAFDIYTIIFLALAVFVFFRLRSVLGQKTGHEQPHYRHREQNAEQTTNKANDDNVVIMPKQRNLEDKRAQEQLDGKEIWKKEISDEPTLETVDKIYQKDDSFTPDNFIPGARSAYEMIVTAFADGDKTTLKDLLSKDVYEGFEQAIEERNKNSQRIETKFVALDKAEIIFADLKKSVASVGLKFKSQLITTTYDKDNNVIDGSPEEVVDVIDIWTFSRDLNSSNPNWKLIATEAEEDEE